MSIICCKKNKSNFFILAALYLSLLAFSCKTLQVEEEKCNPLSLLSTDSSIYVKVPVENHRNLTGMILQTQLTGLSEKNAYTLTGYVDELYAGLGIVSDRSRLEVSASVNVPEIAKKSFLTKKYGWQKKAVSIESEDLPLPRVYEVLYRSDSPLNLCFPSSDILCCAKSIEPLLTKHAAKAEVAQSECYEWLSKDSQDILFYITRPGQYLTTLIGSQVSVGVKSVWGSLTYSDKKYFVEMYLYLPEKKAVKPFVNVLKLSMGMTGARVSQYDDNTIKLSNLSVEYKQIENLFTRDPITGKHFRVEGEKIYSENKK